jgi:hypothetical protein
MSTNHVFDREVMNEPSCSMTSDQQAGDKRAMRNHFSKSYGTTTTLLLSILLLACGPGNGSSHADLVRFDVLVANPQRYAGQYLCTGGVRVDGFEVSGLGAAMFEKDGYPQLTEPAIWVEGADLKSREDCIRTDTNPSFEFCHAVVCGVFETGAGYGHGGGYAHQIRGRDVSAMPSPSATPNAVTVVLHESVAGASTKPSVSQEETPPPAVTVPPTDSLPRQSEIVATSMLGCVPAGPFSRCEDEVLNIEYEVPPSWGEIEAVLRTGGYAGYAYDYRFQGKTAAETEPLAAGGRSIDFSEGRGAMPTDFGGYGHGGLQKESACDTRWNDSYPVCRQITSDVAWMIRFPTANVLCEGVFGSWTTAPTFRVEVNLPKNPTINGFVFEAPLFSEQFADQVETVLYPLLGIRPNTIPSICDESSRQAFDAQLASLIESITDRSADAETLKNVDELIHLAESITVQTSTATPLPVLTVDESAVVSAEVDGPGHLEYTDRLGDDILAWIEELRVTAAERQLADANVALAPFGYRLEPRFDAEWDRTFYDLLREGEAELLLARLSDFWPVSVNDSGTDFLLVAENAPNVFPLYLQVQTDGVEPWEADQSNWLPPGYVDDALARVTFTGFPTITYQVALDDRPVYSGTAVAMGAYMPLRSFTIWDDHWALEVDDHLIIDGQDLGEALGYDAAFGFSLIRGQPFYFFEQGGKVRISYGGQTLPNSYDYVVHNQCCEAAMHNPLALGDAVLFHARWNGTWYFVEAGVYEGEMAGTYRYTAPEGWSFRYPMHWDRLDGDLGLVQDTATGKTVTFASEPTTQAELESWLESEIARKLAATEAANTLAEPLTTEQAGDLTVYRYAVLSRGEGTEALLRTTVFFDRQRRYEFYAAIPSLAEEEYEVIVGSFMPARAN